MELALDIGNSRIKVSLASEGRLLPVQVFGRSDVAELGRFCEAHADVPAIVSSVAASDAQLEGALSKLKKLYRFSYQSRLPFRSLYKNPETLGQDRIAAVAGAALLKPQEDVLVIDAGSCITYDMLSSEGTHLGGAISPGLQMRSRALHEFTGRLPLLEQREFSKLTGQSTEESIFSGVQNGMLAELDGIMDQYHSLYPHLQVMLCGGDSAFLAKRLKYGIFAEPDLVLVGLHHILKLNAL
jgi:type III pantothenate kinase